MIGQPVLSIQGISKRYWLYRRQRDRLRQSLFSRLIGRDFAQPFWALRNISFELAPGEVLGIIGQNGSGKSTLLEIVVGTVQPTEGTVKKRGLLTALLELGAGFHPEFSGRENIFLSGAILGIPEREMKRQVEKIIDFSGIGEFIDQPVKLYSSGMFVRLAFSIATCMEPNILVVDEALAVGDSSFVIQCMNRMEQLKQNGCAILYVTHDIQGMRSLCDRAIWLKQGQQAATGSTLEVTSKYLQFLFNQSSVADDIQNQNNSPLVENISMDMLGGLRPLRNRPDLIRWGTREITIEGFALHRSGKAVTEVFEYNDQMTIEFQIKAETDINSEDIGFGFAFRNERGLEIINSTTYDAGTRFPPLKKGQKMRVTFKLENILAPGAYSLVLSIEDRTHLKIKYYDFIENAVIFRTVSRAPISSVVLPKVDQSYTLVEN